MKVRDAIEQAKREGIDFAYYVVCRTTTMGRIYHSPRGWQRKVTHWEKWAKSHGPAIGHTYDDEILDMEVRKIEYGTHEEMGFRFGSHGLVSTGCEKKRDMYIIVGKIKNSQVSRTDKKIEIATIPEDRLPEGRYEL